MFDLVLRRSSVLPRRRFGPAAGIAAAFYAGAAGFVAWAESQPRVVDRQDVVIKFVAPPPLAAPRAPPPAPVAAKPPAPVRAPALRQVMSDRPRTVLAQAIIAPMEIPQQKPPEQEPALAAAVDATEESQAYEVPAVPGGIGSDPVVDASIVELVHAAPALAGGGGGPSGRMVPPRFVSGPSVQYTQKAIEHEVEGVMEVRCIVSAEDGRVRDCRVLRSLPFMDRAVIDALEQRRYAPATLGGQAVDVYYRFRLPFHLADAS